MGAPIDYAVVIGILLLVIALHALGLPWWASFLIAFVVAVAIVIVGAWMIHHTLNL